MSFFFCFNLFQFKCSICNKVIKSKGSNLKRHMNLHYNPDRVKCGLCAKTFSSIYNFRKHCQNTHRDVNMPIPSSSTKEGAITQPSYPR